MKNIGHLSPDFLNTCSSAHPQTKRSTPHKDTHICKHRHSLFPECITKINVAVYVCACVYNSVYMVYLNCLSLLSWICSPLLWDHETILFTSSSSWKSLDLKVSVSVSVSCKHPINGFWSNNETINEWTHLQDMKEKTCYKWIQMLKMCMVYFVLPGHMNFFQSIIGKVLNPKYMWNPNYSMVKIPDQTKN